MQTPRLQPIPQRTERNASAFSLRETFLQFHCLFSTTCVCVVDLQTNGYFQRFIQRDISSLKSRSKRAKSNSNCDRTTTTTTSDYKISKVSRNHARCYSRLRQQITRSSEASATNCNQPASSSLTKTTAAKNSLATNKHRGDRDGGCLP